MPNFIRIITFVDDITKQFWCVFMGENASFEPSTVKIHPGVRPSRVDGPSTRLVETGLRLNLIRLI